MSWMGYVVRALVMVKPYLQSFLERLKIKIAAVEITVSKRRPEPPSFDCSLERNRLIRTQIS